ncbi:diguanylate cyclase (GGDEF)-like protein [Neorhizobium galegae]|uniref:putative bifunctional diguanylate cyclase/phosphodiesterase n=1 Tax=Neorhizobium galegae TaxID=399 RepID=UPI001AE98759|nr:bifunctional diguanylate cyclase/phosphodiesterase [Neorhizobium galegae]MBP2547320.1 diguanylate cyclase (GGDEF)-like protein [Neorhizobium galegae]
MTPPGTGTAHPPLPACVMQRCDAHDVSRFMLDRLDTAVWVFDIDAGQVVWANASALNIWAADTLDELRARQMKPGMSPAVARRLAQYQTDFIERDASFSEMWTLYPRGVPRPLRVRFSGIRLSDGRMAMLCEGLDETGQLPEAIRSADALLHTQLMISLHDLDGRTLYCNPAARASFEGSDDLASRFVHADDLRRLLAAIRDAGEISLIAEVYTSKGIRWHELTARSCHDPASGRPSVLVSETDVSELKEAEALAHMRANHDPLTGLPNRLAMPALFERLSRQAERSGARIGVLFIDLDQFKAINDTLGHLQGDAVLMEVSRRLFELRGKDDAVIRLGGDEFLFLATEERTEEGRIEALAGRILERLALPVQAERRKLMVTPSVGIARYPDHGADVQILMRRADLAMYEAKAAGRNQACTYDDGMRNRREDEVALLADLREGLRRGQIVAYYQPRVAPGDGRIVSAEALARWVHPEQGIVAPDVFIPLAEKAGLIAQVGACMMEQAIRQQSLWAKAGFSISVSVNVSVRQLCEADFAGMVQRLLAFYDADPTMLELELTETLLLESNPTVHDNLDQVRALGIRIAIDDFGTGYSNLARLNDMAVDCIKIDRSLISGLPRNEEIVRLVIAMCKFMQVTIVAEGIENQCAADWARANGCHELQGYLYSRPVPVAELEIMLERDRLAAYRRPMPETVD